MSYHSTQYSFYKTPQAHQFCHGGELRKSRRGRGRRALSCKESLHVVFKVNKLTLRHQSLRSPSTFLLVQRIIARYAKRFLIKIEHISIQHDHIHILIRTSRRSSFHNFFRVVAGQMAQRFEKEGLLRMVTDTPETAISRQFGKLKRKLKLWKQRPFSRVVRGYRAYRIVRNYIQLNEKEVLGYIKYQSQRLRGLSMSDWKILWS